MLSLHTSLYQIDLFIIILDIVGLAPLGLLGDLLPQLVHLELQRIGVDQQLDADGACGENGLSQLSLELDLATVLLVNDLALIIETDERFRLQITKVLLVSLTL